MIHRIDENGFHIDSCTDDFQGIPENWILTSVPIPPGNFIKLRLVNSQWIEGATEEEIETDYNSKLALTEKYPGLIGMNFQLLQLDNLPGIKRLEPISDKGLKGEKKYTKDGQLIWSIKTTYWFEEDTESNPIYPDGVVKTVRLFDMGGEIVDAWNKQVELSADDKEVIRKEQRERIMSYFKSQQPELFGFLYAFFRTEIEDYISVGKKSAFEAILTDAAANHPYQSEGVYVVRVTLNQEIPTQSGGTTTVLQGIIYELV